MAIEKLSSTAHKLSVFFRVLQRILIGVMIAMICVLTILSILNTVNPDAVIGTELNEIDLGSVTITLASERTPDNSSILCYAWIYAAIGLIWGAALWFGLHLVRRMLQPMTEGCPFHADTARQIKKLAILSLVMGIVDNLAESVEAMAVLHTLDLAQLLNGAVESLTINHTFELGFIVVFFLLLLLSYLFSYGAELQQLSDETL